MPDVTPYDDEVNFLDYWNILCKRRRLVFPIVGVVMIASVVYSLLAQKIYTSTAVLFPPQPDLSMLGQSSATAPVLPMGLFGMNSAGALWVRILGSDTVLDAVIDRFDLMTVFEAETRVEARKALSGRVNTSKSKEDVVSISVDDTDPKRAALIAGALVEELDRVNRSLLTTTGGRMRVFVEKRLGEEKRALTKAEEALKAFQEANGAVQLDAQSRALVDAIGTLRGQLMAKEVEIQALLTHASRHNPAVEALKAQIQELRAGLVKLEEGSQGTPKKSILIPSAKIPDLALQYARLLRDVTVKETLYALLTQQYEMARIQEAKDNPTVQVLDPPQVPEKRSRPKRTLIVLLSTFGAMVLSLFLAFSLEAIEKMRAQARP